MRPSRDRDGLCRFQIQTDFDFLRRIETASEAFPSFGVGFDSHRPLQILKDLGRCLSFHYFQNVNFVAKPNGKFSAYLFEGNFPSIKCRHRR
jgi:hypothetical protein